MKPVKPKKKTIYIKNCDWLIKINDARDARTVRAMVRAADDGGMLQAENMRRFVHDPTKHTAMKLSDAVRLFGTLDDGSEEEPR